MFELWEHNGGIDGWDPTRRLVAYFSSIPKAMDWLERRGYTYPEYDSYAHKDESKRHTMGKLSYTVKPHMASAVPVDPN